MNVTIGKDTYYLEKCEGVFAFLKEEGFDKVNMSHLDTEIFKLVLKDNLVDIPTFKLIDAFKMVYYLNMDTKLKLYGKEIARRLKLCTYNGIRQVLFYFESVF